MSNLFWKMILITLCISLLCTVGISANGGEAREVYVRTGASGNGTALSPVGTLTDAVNLLNGKGGRIVLLSEVTVSSATTLIQSRVRRKITKRACISASSFWI